MDKTSLALPSRRAMLALLAGLPLGGCLGNGTRPSFAAREGGADELAGNPLLHVVTTRRLAQGG